jgi:hypothetical protein
MHVPPLRSCELRKNRWSACHILIRGITAYLSGSWTLEGRGENVVHRDNNRRHFKNGILQEFTELAIADVGLVSGI